MKKYIYLLAALTMVPQLSLAKASTIAKDVEAELDQMYTTQENDAGTKELKAGTAGITSSGTVSGQPIYILNQATPTSTTQVQTAQVQKQPTTIVEATPLVESRAEMIKKSRQDAEVQTEQKIVEKLEVSRLEDEKKRANVLFGDSFNKLEQNNNIHAQNVNVNAQQTSAAVIAPVTPVTPVAQTQQPIVIKLEQASKAQKEDLEEEDVVSKKISSRDTLREEIKVAMDLEKEKAAIQAPTTQKFFSAMAGLAQYPDAMNVKGNYSLGASFGTRRDSLIIEGSFQYSNYTVDSYVWDNYYSLYDYRQIDMNSYAGSIAGKFQLLDGLVRPVVGGLVQYTYRDYTLKDNMYVLSDYTTANSQSIDVGVVTGVDFEFSPATTLGVDFRYMFNMSNKVSNVINNPYGFYPGPNNTTPIEKLNYWVLSLVARTTF